MHRTRIVTDSTADLSPEQASRYGITVVPVSVSFGSESYIDGVTLSRGDFYSRLSTSGELPRTSQPTPAAFAEVYRQLARTADTILSIHISGRLSGTLNSAVVARDMVGANVMTVDTKTASQGVGRSVLVAGEAVRRGFDVSEVRAVLSESIRSTFSVFAARTLEYLRRNGRIGRAAALLGSILQVKPILYADVDGMVAAYDKVRGQSKIVPRLISSALENVPGGSSVDVSVVHSGPEDEARDLLDRLARIYDVVEKHVGMVGPAIAV